MYIVLEPANFPSVYLSYNFLSLRELLRFKDFTNTRCHDCFIYTRSWNGKFIIFSVKRLFCVKYLFLLLFLTLRAFHSRKLIFVFQISIQLLSKVDYNEYCLSTNYPRYFNILWCKLCSYFTDISIFSVLKTKDDAFQTWPVVCQCYISLMRLTVRQINCISALADGSISLPLTRACIEDFCYYCIASLLEN